MSRAAKRKRLQRAAQAVPSGGNMIPQSYINAAIQQAMKQQASNDKNKGEPLFSPGNPLDPQPGVNPQGYPRQWSFPIAYNTSGLDRTLQQPDIPPFQQLRNLAELYEGIALCEKVWLDLIPALQLKIQPRKDLLDQDDVDMSKYQGRIDTIMQLFKKPDGVRNLHSWLRMAIIEQTQIDALYMFKQRDKAGRLISLKIVAGDTMKPLLDDWGNIVAYQQFPWGIPGDIFTPDQMIYFAESPRASTPYGRSRVERILMRVNQALRKEKKDLAYFTEGNQPFAIMETPEASNWTPDQIETYETMWNALIAGNVQQQVRVKFTQPGMKYVPLEQYQLLSEFDQFILNIATADYGLSMADLSFTGDIHKSSDHGQQNMLYRRTMAPVVSMYAGIITDIIHEDFQEPDLEATFTGYEEEDDIVALSTAYSTLTNSGILGISNAGKMLKLPEDPDAPHIGRIIITKTGPIFLDDLASDEMRNAAIEAQKAGFDMAANPPEENDEDTGTSTTQSQQKKAPAKETTQDTKKPATARSVGETDNAGEDYRRWRGRALDDIKTGRAQRGFTTTLIPEYIHERISDELAGCSTADEVREVFRRVQGGV